MKGVINVGVQYQLILEDGGILKCTRHGEEFRDLTGNKLALRMFQRIQELEKEVSDLNTENYHLEDEVSALEAELSQGE